MCITINAIESCTDIPDCMKTKEIRTATLDDENLGILTELVLCIWPQTKAEIQWNCSHTGHLEMDL